MNSTYEIVYIDRDGEDTIVKVRFFEGHEVINADGKGAAGDKHFTDRVLLGLDTITFPGNTKSDADIKTYLDAYLRARYPNHTPASVHQA